MEACDQGCSPVVRKLLLQLLRMHMNMSFVEENEAANADENSAGNLAEAQTLLTEQPYRLSIG